MTERAEKEEDELCADGNATELLRAVRRLSLESSHPATSDYGDGK